MFENEIKFISDLTNNKLKSLGSTITIPRMKEAGVHPAIIKYISAEIEYLVFEDRQKLLRNSIFDYSGSEIENSFSVIAKSIIAKKRFGYEYISKLVLHAVSFNINFLCRPNWTIIRFLFESKNLKSIPEIKQILNYVYYYDYLIKIISAYLEKKQVVEIEKNELKDVLNKIDEVNISTNYQFIIETALNEISDFFGLANNSKQIPTDAVYTFLQDKNLRSISLKLKEFSTEHLISKTETTRFLLEEFEFHKRIFEEENNIADEESIELNNPDTLSKDNPPNENESLSNTPSDLQQTAPEEQTQHIKIKNTPASQNENQNELDLFPENDKEKPKIDLQNDNAEDTNSPDTSETYLNADNDYLPESGKENPSAQSSSEENIITIKLNVPISEGKPNTGINENSENNPRFDSETANENKNSAIFDEMEEIEELILDEINLSEEVEFEEIPSDEFENVDIELAIDESETQLESINTENTPKLEIISNLEDENNSDSNTIQNLSEGETDINSVADFAEGESFSETIDLTENENEISLSDLDTNSTNKAPETGKINNKTADTDSIHFENEQSQENSINVLETKETFSKKSFSEKISDTIKVFKKGKKKTKDNVENDPNKSNFASTKNLDNTSYEISSKDILDKESLIDKSDTEIKKTIENSGNEELDNKNLSQLTFENISNSKNKVEIDISDLLEHKKMTKIIEVVFDYDMEDFSNVIEKISKCNTFQEAEATMESILSLNNIKENNKELKIFKEIISQYFDE